MKNNMIQFEKNKNKIDYSLVFDKILNDIKDTSELYNKYIASFENLIKTKEIDKLDKEQREDIIKEIIYNTEYFLYKLKATLNNPI